MLGYRAVISKEQMHCLCLIGQELIECYEEDGFHSTHNMISTIQSPLLALQTSNDENHAIRASNTILIGALKFIEDPSILTMTARTLEPQDVRSPHVNHRLYTRRTRLPSNSGRTGISDRTKLTVNVLKLGGEIYLLGIRPDE